MLNRFLQGPETDQGTVDKIRAAIREQREITVQLINYTKSGEIYLQLNVVNHVVWASCLTGQMGSHANK